MASCPHETSGWARQNGITDKAAWKWWKAGKLPIPARRMPTGTVLLNAPGTIGGGRGRPLCAGFFGGPQVGSGPSGGTPIGVCGGTRPERRRVVAEVEVD